MFDRLIDWILGILHQINPFVLINEYEWAVLLREGKVKKTLKTGLHLLPLKSINLDSIHACSKQPDTYRLSGINITTIDNKTVNVGIAVEYEIVDPIKWLIKNTTAEGNFHDIAWGTCGEHLTTLEWENIKQKSTRTAIKNKIAKAVDHLGVNIIDVSFGDIVLHKVLTIFKE